MNRMLIAALLLFATSANGADIYKCTDAEGNVAYMQTPCPIEKKKVAEPAAEAEPIEFNAPEVAPQVPVVDNRTDEEIVACKKPHRDEIDSIYVALGDAYTPEQGEEFKNRLRTLTQHLRACG